MHAVDGKENRLCNAELFAKLPYSIASTILCHSISKIDWSCIDAKVHIQTTRFWNCAMDLLLNRELW
jgi:predicted metal-dependent peptidase